MVAAENGALPGGKVGGIGDVIRDVPKALAARGHQVTVVNPGYGFLSRLPSARRLCSLTLEFAASLQEVTLFEIEAHGSGAGVRMLLLEHPLFAPGAEPAIYHHDRFEPFATDARSFALFCHALCHALVTRAIPRPDVLHLHDWHASMVLVLRASHPAYRALRALPTVFSIHNLSLQGIRPLQDNWSSLASWFPGRSFPLQAIRDPRYPDCLNLMRAGIRLADKVHAVSPTYAREICLPSDPSMGLVRGEGLEGDLQEASEQGRLFGILNGCDYDNTAMRRPSHRQFVLSAMEALDSWAEQPRQESLTLFRALQRLHAWQAVRRKPGMVIGSVGRLSDQKISLLRQPMPDGRPALDHMLGAFDQGVMILLGSGAVEHERFFLEMMARHEHFLFLNGFSEGLAEQLYSYCDLFLMPSTFEPCGISQMLAMRAGQPCLVHAVGGLVDTVEDGVNGFTFSGRDDPERARVFLQRLDEALQMRREQPRAWQALVESARAARFLWADAARACEEQLYR